LQHDNEPSHTALSDNNKEMPVSEHPKYALIWSYEAFSYSKTKNSPQKVLF
jgi:hypothetical protein